MGLNATYDEARALGCIIATEGDKEDYDVELGLGRETCKEGARGEGRPCPAYNGGKCPCYLAHHSSARARQAGNAIARAHRETPQHGGLVGGDLAGLSIKQIAAKLDVSKGEVRRLKTTGALKNGTPRT